MIAQGEEGGKALKVDLPPLPGEVAFRVTIQPSPCGCAWSTDARPALPALGAAEPAQSSAPEAPKPAGHSTHALDELFARGL